MRDLMALRPDAQASFSPETKLEPWLSSPWLSSPWPSSPWPFRFAVAFFAARFTLRLAVARLVSLITSFKDAPGKRQLNGTQGSSRAAVTAGRNPGR
jgi:hypothetical protein